MALVDMFENIKFGLDADIDILLPILLKRASDTNVFLS